MARNLRIGSRGSDVLEVQTLRSQAPAPISRSVAGWLPYWYQASGFASVKANAEVFDQLSPYWYRLESNGAVGKFPFAEDPEIIAFVRNKGIRLIPLISNEFNQELIFNLINSPELRTQHIQNLVHLVQSKNYDGIDLNYENLPREDRDVFPHSLGKPPKRSERFRRGLS